MLFFYVFAMRGGLVVLVQFWKLEMESWGGILCWHQGAAALLNHVLLILVLSDQCTFRSQIYHLLSNEFMFHGFPTQKPLKILATSTMNIQQWMAGWVQEYSTKAGKARESFQKITKVNTTLGSSPNCDKNWWPQDAWKLHVRKWFFQVKFGVQKLLRCLLFRGTYQF